MAKRKLSPRRIRETTDPVAVGDLRAEPRSSAADIQAALVDGEHLVWADEDHTVYVSRGSIPMLPDHWIIGTYMMGAPIDGFAQDVTEMRRQRSKDFIID